MRYRYLIFLTILVFTIILSLINKWTSLNIFNNIYAKSQLFKKLSNKIANKVINKDSPLTIFMITNNYDPYSGGVTQAINTYTQELRNQKHKVIIITLDFLGLNNYQEQDVIRLWCPIRFTYKKNPIAIPFNSYKTIENLIYNYKPNIIHVHHPFVLGAIGLKLAKKYSIPVVFTYHTQYEHYLHYIPLPSVITRPITKYLVNDFCDKVDLIITINKSLNLPIKNKVTLPSGVSSLFDMPKFNYKNSKERFSLLTVSRFAKEKNIPFLLDAYKLLDKTKYSLTLIGYGNEQEELEKYAYDKLGLSPEDVTFIIKPNKQELISQYRQADLFIFASLTEMQGLVLAEAMSQGTPVVALNGTGSKDIIKQGKNGFLITSIPEMINKINTIAYNPKLHKALQYNAWKSTQNYSSKKHAEKLTSLYYILINNKNK